MNETIKKIYIVFAHNTYLTYKEEYWLAMLKLNLNDAPSDK